MKKLFFWLIIILIIFSLNISAAEPTSLDLKNDNLAADSEQNKTFSDSARQELLGIASQFDQQKNSKLDISNFDFQSQNLELPLINLNRKQKLNLSQNFKLNANYQQKDAKKIETAADFQLEYALNPRTSIRAGYAVSNQEWWNLRLPETKTGDSETELDHDQGQNNDSGVGEESNLNSSFDKVYQNEIESSHSLGLAYKTSDRLEVSADYIENNDFGSYYDQSWDLVGNSQVFGLKYSYPKGSSISARYQVDQGDDATQQVTGVDLTFNNLATFSAAYKLLDFEEIENDLFQQKTAWDLGLGVQLNEDYGLALGYEIIETEDQKESEKKFKASFEINF